MVDGTLLFFRMMHSFLNSGIDSACMEILVSLILFDIKFVLSVDLLIKSIISLADLLLILIGGGLTGLLSGLSLGVKATHTPSQIKTPKSIKWVNHF